jgi:hypothetical protein
MLLHARHLPSATRQLPFRAGPDLVSAQARRFSELDGNSWQKPLWGSLPDGHGRSLIVYQGHFTLPNAAVPKKKYPDLSERINYTIIWVIPVSRVLNYPTACHKYQQVILPPVKIFELQQMFILPFYICWFSVRNLLANIN